MKSEQEQSKVGTALILAAGHGTRIREHSRELPKPLLRLGGLLLIERAILNLKSAGIRRFRIVVGYEKEQIISRVNSLKSLKGLEVEFVFCEDYEKGNGASLAWGARGLESNFVVAMADHVMDAKFPKAFLDKVFKGPDRCALATDANVTGVFDLEDATKVEVVEGCIQKLGKDLKSYQEIDTGLFYFTKDSLPIIERAYKQASYSVSEIVLQIAEAQSFRSVPVADNLFWQDVDTPEMAYEAESRILNSLRKPTDGWVSKNINRYVSLFLSRRFANWGIHPNTITTVVFFVTLGAAWLATTSDLLWMAVAGIIFQLCSIVDGCDGEVARLTHKGSHFGAWYDTITDNIRYGIFFCALGVGAYNSGHEKAYLWGMAFFAFSLIYMVASMIRYERTVKAATHLVVTAKFEAKGRESKAWWDRLIMPLRGLIKQDVSAFIVMWFCILGLGYFVFWAACFAILVMTVTVTRALDPKAENKAMLLWLIKSPYVLFLGGVALFAYLFNKVPTDELMLSLSNIGSGYFWIFFLAPPIWFVANAFSLWCISDGRIKLLDLIYNQIVGEAANALLPLAGLGGEPYKVKHMSQWIGVEDATRTVVQDRLVHVVSGLLLSGVLGFGTLSLVKIQPMLEGPIFLVSLVFLVLALLSAFVSLSRVPSNFAMQILKRLKFLSEYKDNRLSVSKFSMSLFYKMVGRVAALLEAYVLLRCLGISADWSLLVAVSFFVSASSVIFFLVPQGLGVAEAGIAGAFKLAGLAVPQALAFGVARRIRVLFWAFSGIALYFCMGFLARFVQASNKQLHSGD